jgi:uncharacterized protein (TIRG00374 family)
MGDSFSYYMIGYMANVLLPLRAGEVIRPYLFGQRKGVATSAVLATVVVERLFDILSLLALIAVITAVMEIPPEVRQSAYALEAAALVLLALLWVGARTRSGVGPLGRLLDLLPGQLGGTLEGWLRSARTGLATLRSPQAVAEVVLASLMMWFCNTLTLQSYLSAFGLDLPWHAPLFAIVVSNLGMMIPSSPGFVGVAHFLYVLSLSVFGVDRATALAFAVVAHGVSAGVVVLAGLLSLWSEGLRFSHLAQAAHLPEQPSDGE